MECRPVLIFIVLAGLYEGAQFFRQRLLYTVNRNSYRHRTKTGMRAGPSQVRERCRHRQSMAHTSDSESSSSPHWVSSHRFVSFFASVAFAR